MPLHSPYIDLTYGRYLQFRFLKWPLIMVWADSSCGCSNCRSKKAVSIHKSHTHIYILFVYETTVYINMCVNIYIYMALFENWITNDTHSTGSYHYLVNMVILEISPCSKSWFRISPLNSFSVYELPSGSGHSNGLLFKWMNMAQLWMIYDDLPIQMIKLMI